MADFFQALFQHGFLQHALLAGWLASISCGVVGTYVVTRRITYLAGALPTACWAAWVSPAICRWCTAGRS